MTAGSDTPADDEEWKFTVEEVGEEPAAQSVAGEEAEEQDGNGTGLNRDPGPLEPGTIDLENAIFVLIGVLLVVGLLVAVMLGL